MLILTALHVFLGLTQFFIYKALFCFTEWMAEQRSLGLEYNQNYLFSAHFLVPQVIQVERERSLKWGKMIQKWHKYVRTEKLHRRVNKGIPNSVRGSVWSHVLQIEAVKEEGIYEVGV